RLSVPRTDCAFCAVVAGGGDAHVVFEDEISLAFLDNRPLFPGHALLVPRAHHEAIWDLPDDLVGPLFLNARLLASAVREAMASTGALVGAKIVGGQSVPHFHVPLVPRNRKDGLRGVFWPRRKYPSEAEAEAAGDAVREAVARL